MSRICIFGAGAIGGFLGTILVRGGAQVSLVARGRGLAAIRERGITVRMHAGPDLHVRVHAASDDPAELGPQDFVLVTVKSVALPEVAAGIKPLLSPSTAVAFITNGIPWWYDFGASAPVVENMRDELDAGGSLHRIVGAERAIGGVAYSACTVVEPGLVHSVTIKNRLIIGEPAGQISGRVQALAGMLEAGGLCCEVTRDIRAAVWRKLMTNLACGPVCLLSGRSVRESFSDPVLRDTATRLVEEGLAIASAALGYSLDVRAEAMIAGLGSLDHKPSILQDLELGRPTEFDTLLGMPQKLARLKGVETPTLDSMVALARQAVDTLPHDRSMDVPG